MRRVISHGLAVAIVLVACGDAASHMVGDAGSLADAAGGILRDAGMWLSDAGRSAQDASAREGGSAQAQSDESMTVNCDQTFTSTQIGSDSTTTWTYWYAKIDADTSSVTSVDAVLCGTESFGTMTACPSGSTCTGSSGPDNIDCTAQSGASLQQDSVWVSCGQRFQVSYSASLSLPDVDSGSHRLTAKITIRR